MIASWISKDPKTKKTTFSSDDMKWPAKFERRKILQILNEQVVQYGNTGC